MRLLGTGRLADLVNDLLVGDGLVVVAGDHKLAAALAARERQVAIAADEGDRSSAKLDLRALRLAELEPGSASGAVIAGAGRDESGGARLAELSRVVAAGGSVVLLDKVARVKASHYALIAGLSRLEQHVVARTVVTAGVVGPRL